MSLPSSAKGLSVFLFLALSLMFAGSGMAQIDRLTGRPFATRSPVMAREGMVATSQPLATQVGLQILREGGSAGC